MTPERIRKLRHALGDTQAEFAARLGVSVRAVAGWELGEHEPLPLAVQAMEALAAAKAKRRRAGG